VAVGLARGVDPVHRRGIPDGARPDHEVHGQHVRTLRTFLATNGSLIDTARELFLHTNTVRHRLGRIHEITGRNPMSFEDQAAFAIGLRASDRARRMPGRPD
ncbi:PucR family transcriptional regulator, partial [Mycolicibacterium porcinum]|uniref:PucR family transcriptional regulator n=1 Tax=Mycolicibacterium porcinum TaxID=39693 RepID=UPI0010425727